MSRYKFFTFTLIFLLKLFSISSVFAETIDKVQIFKNAVPLQMLNLDNIKSTGISIHNLSKKVGSGKIEEAVITCSTGKEFPNAGGYCSLQYKVSNFFITRYVTLEFITSETDRNHYILEGRYKIGKNSSKWSGYTTIASFTTLNDAAYNLKTKNIENILVIKKL